MVYAESLDILLQVVGSIVSSPDAAYDVLQNLGVKILELDSKTEIRFPEAYLRREARHAAVDYIQRESRYVLTDPNIWSEVRIRLLRQMPGLKRKISCESICRGYFPRCGQHALGISLAENPLSRLQRRMPLKAATLWQQFRRIRRRITRKRQLLTLLCSMLQQTGCHVFPCGTSIVSGGNYDEWEIESIPERTSRPAGRQFRHDPSGGRGYVPFSGPCLTFEWIME